MGWIQGRRVAPDVRIPFILALALSPSQRSTLETCLRNVSDPTRSNYGHYLTNDDITTIVQARPSLLRQITRTLRTHGLTQVKPSRNRDYLLVEGPASHIEALWNLELFHYHHHQDSNAMSYIRANVSTLDWHPDLLPFQSDIALIHGLVEFPKLKKRTASVSNILKNSKITLENDTNAPQVLVPQSWTGTNVTLLTILRTQDRQVLRQADLFLAAETSMLQRNPTPTNMIPSEVIVTVDPVSETLGPTIVAFKSHVLFQHQCRECKAMDSRPFRGHPPQRVCFDWLASVGVPEDTLVCQLSVPDVVVGTPSRVRVQTLYPDGTSSAAGLSIVQVR